MKQIYFLLLLLFSTYYIKGQNVISGKIKGVSGEVVSNAKIIAKQSKTESFSNKNGEFSIQINKEIDTLLIEKNGFQNKEIPTEVFKNSSIVILEVIDIFEMSLDDLMNIEVVSAGKVSQKINEAPAIISVITKQQIREAGYRTVAEAIQSVPGIDVLNDYLHSNIGVRGVNGGLRAWSRIMKVMINNQPVSFRSSSENWLDEELIPLNAIQRIEIVRGPSSALYGANAFLGVINIITQTGEEANGGYVSIFPGMYGENTFFGGDLMYGKSYKYIDFIFSLSATKIDRSGLGVKNLPGFTNYANDSISKNDLSKPASIYTKISYKNEKIGTIYLDFNYQHLDKFGEFQDYGVLTHKNHLKMYNYYLRTGLNKEFSDKFSFNTSVSFASGSPYKDEKLAINYIGYADYMTRKVSYNSIDFAGETRYTFKEKNNITAGIDYSNEDHLLQSYYRVFNGVTTPMGGFELGRKQFSNLGIYLQPMLNFGELFNVNSIKSLNFTFGLRYDKNNIYEDVINYRTAVVYQLTNTLYLKGMYGTSYKAPASNQLYTTLLKPGTDIVGNPNLKPEKAKTYEAAFGGIFSNGLNFSLNGFNNIIDGKVEIEIDPSVSSNLIAKNVNQITSYGGEASIGFSNKQISTYTNFSYQLSTYESKENFLSDKMVEFESKLYPTYMSKTGFTYRFTKYHFAINTEGKWIDGRLSSLPNTLMVNSFDFIPYELSNYFTIDACISTIDLKVIKNYETIFSIKMNNILNTKFYYPGFKDFDIQGEPRIIYLKIVQSF